MYIICIFKRSTAFSVSSPRPRTIARSSASLNEKTPFLFSLAPGLLNQGMSLIFISMKIISHYLYFMYIKDTATLRPRLPFSDSSSLRKTNPFIGSPGPLKTTPSLDPSRIWVVHLTSMISKIKRNFSIQNT